jgi:hypothetical protein
MKKINFAQRIMILVDIVVLTWECLLFSAWLASREEFREDDEENKP